MEINVDLIKTNIIKKYFTDRAKEDIRKMVEMTSTYPLSSTNNLTQATCPIFYLFDPQINASFGSQFAPLSNIRSYFDLDNLFNLNSSVMTNIIFSNHATIFCIDVIDGRTYIYYSNSGFGINYNVRDFEGNVSPKIYYVMDNLFAQKIPHEIEKIIFEITKLSSRDFEGSKPKIHYVFEQLMSSLDKRLNIEKQDFINFAKNIYNDNTKIQMACYMLLNYISSKNPDICTECSTNHMINGFDDDQFSAFVTQQSSSIITLMGFYNKSTNPQISTQETTNKQLIKFDLINNSLYLINFCLICI